MQTFLPSNIYDECAKILDWRRLGKQRVEAYQILNVLTGRTAKLGWRNHPAVLMWKGYEDSLGAYMNACIIEWLNRGYRNTMQLWKVPAGTPKPHWMGSEALHASHRSNLLRKDPVYYGRYGWIEEPNLPYVWPVTK